MKRQHSNSEHSGSNRFFAWLSPKPPRRQEQYMHCQDDSDNEGDSPLTMRRRSRRASFDETHQTSLKKSGQRLNRENKTGSYGERLNYSNCEGSPEIMASRSADHTPDRSSTARSSPRSQPQTQSLLTVLLFQLNELLPEYCEHLSTATQTTQSNGASKAVDVLEKGGNIDLSSVSEVPSHAIPQSLSPVKSSGGTSVQPSMTKHFSLNDDNPPDPSSPSRSGFSPMKCLSPKSDRREVSHVPKSAPTSPRHPQYLALKQKTMSFGKGILGRSHQNAKSQINAVAHSEWERFVSPFLMLAGAEVLYGQMQHVISPQSEKEYDKTLGMGNFAKKGGNESTVIQAQEPVQAPNDANGDSFFGSVLESLKQIYNNNDHNSPSIGTPGRIGDGIDKPLVSFALNHLTPTRRSSAGGNVSGTVKDSDGPQPSAISPLNDTQKRGSRRLIAMYRQCRDDIVIVGEYLCDPVLGAKKPSPPKVPPFPPILSHTSSSAAINLNPTSYSPLHDKDDDVGGVTGLTEFVPLSPEQIREQAASSLRQTIDSLIAFIDCRCVLIRIHAELCLGKKSSHNASIAASHPTSPSLFEPILLGEDQMKVNRWIPMAAQCRSIIEDISPLTTSATTAKSVLDRMVQEAKAFELALISVKNVAECSFFDCVVSTRKLRVLLDRIPSFKDDLPTLWTRSILVGVLSLMNIYFAKLSPKAFLAPRPAHQQEPLTKRRSFSKQDDSSAKGTPKSTKIINFDQSISNFTLKSKAGLPLAVILARKKMVNVRTDSNEAASCSHLDESEKRDEDDQVETSCESWEPMYLNSSSSLSQNSSTPETSSSRRRSNTPPNILQKMMSERLNIQQSPVSQANDTHTTWPMTEWPQIQNCLIENSNTDHDALITCSGSTKYSLLNEDGKKLFRSSSQETRTSDPDLEKTPVRPISASSPSSIRANLTSLTSLAGAAITGNTSNANTSSKNLTSFSPRSERKVKAHIHVAPVTESLALVVIQSTGDPRHNKKRHISDEDISTFIENLALQLSPENLFSINSLIKAKHDITDVKKQQTNDSILEKGKPDFLMSSPKCDLPASLWSDTAWESKKVLNKLGIRKSASPIMAPLKSPYIRRQIKTGGRQKKKKIKSSINHGHLDFFLGPELSQML